MESLLDRSSLTPRVLNMCDKLVEYLHIEVMGSEGKNVPVYPVHEETPKVEIPKKEPVIYAGQINCPVCGNVITGSNKSLICMKCRSRFCSTCEEWFRVERKRGEKPLCEKCFGEEQERLRKKEEKRVQREKEEQERQQREEEERKKSQENPQTYTNSIGMKFNLIPAGEFMMGSEEYDREKPVHKVTISKPFYLGIYPVTQKEWKAVMGDNPSYFKGDDLPVEKVSWSDVQEFIKKLNEKESGNKYRLPSEAEWEYAARASTTTRFSFGDDESKLGDCAWYAENSGSRPPKKGDYFGYDKDDWFSFNWNGKTHLSVRKNPIHGDCTICMGTSGNGCRIYGMIAITALLQTAVHGKVEVARAVSFAAAGSTARGPFALRAAPTTMLTAAATFSAFAF